MGGAYSGGCLVETPPDGYCCGWYASYWNAFLFGNIFAEKCMKIKEIGPRGEGYVCP